ncbi:hypothetical protein GCM10011352_25040 [Marinobacterium zhoushanense]|uniref:Uncharacterized protein n=1 Tax=Marinobacterium zhoushanense TaxID=1679163 RepID=A0ABQ1KFB3_9GAMM|nr:hypothetical protein GCM10011352_25040 [Marinobacterium zhoushanense]
MLAKQQQIRGDIGIGIEFEAIELQHFHQRVLAQSLRVLVQQARYRHKQWVIDHRFLAGHIGAARRHGSPTNVNN